MRLTSVAIGVVVTCGLFGGWSLPGGPPVVTERTQAVGQRDGVEVVGDEALRVGAIEVGRRVSHSRVFRNTGTCPVSLRVVSSSCPCVSVEIDPAGGAVEPGREARVAISTPVTAADAEQTHWALIEASSSDAVGRIVSTQRARIVVSFWPDLAFLVEPTSICIHAVRGESARRTVYIRSDTLDALNVRGIRTDVQGVRVLGQRRLKGYAENRPNEEAWAVDIGGRVVGARRVLRVAAIRDR